LGQASKKPAAHSRRKSSPCSCRKDEAARMKRDNRYHFIPKKAPAMQCKAGALSMVEGSRKHGFLLLFSVDLTVWQGRNG